MKTLKTKVIAITGAGSGIGRALALDAAKQGASVAICDRNADSLAETVALLGDAPYLASVVDVRSDAEILAFAAAVAEKFGPAHVIVNNAGVALSHYFDSQSREDFEWVMDINFWGVVRGTEAFLPQLKTHDDAHIVNISSLFGLVGVPSQSAYNASKFAVRGLSESLRQELHDTPIHVSCVHPGGIDTNIIRNGKHLQGADGKPTTTASLARSFARTTSTTPDGAARIIWAGVLRNRGRILIGPETYAMDLVQRLLPAGYPAVLRPFLRIFSTKQR